MMLLATLAYGVQNVHAQTIVHAVNSDDLIATSAKADFGNTGVATSIWGGYQIVANVFENNGNAILNWHEYANIFPDGEIIIQDAKDPDIEFYTNMDLLFVAYYNSNGVFINSYTLSTLNGYNYWNTIQLSSSPDVKSVNIDYSQNAFYPQSGTGTIIWEEDGTIFSSSFDPSFSVPMPVVPIAMGTEPDIAINHSDKYSITYINPNQDLVSENGSLPSLMGGFHAPFYTHVEPAVGGYFFHSPRIAAPHEIQSTGIFYNQDGYAVTAILQNSGTSEHLVWAKYIENNNAIMNTDISWGGDHAINTFPVVTFANGHVKFQWTSDYSPNPIYPIIWSYNPSNPAFDILSLELNPYDPTSMSDIYEINLAQGAGFEYCKSSISGARTYQSNGVAFNFTAYLYNHRSQIFNKWLYDFADPKRLSQHNNEFDFYNEDQNYYLEGENMQDYSYSLFNIQGQEIDLGSNISIHNSEVSFTINELAQGMYIFKCTNDAVSESFKIMVTK